MIFSEFFKPLLIEKEVSQSLLSTESTVQACLNKRHFGPEDLPTLLSPVAAKYLEQMAQKAHALTLQRFGRTMQIFIPLYLSNECFNNCSYCGFSMKFDYKRKTLSDAEILHEGQLLSDKGFQHLLLLTGESPKTVGVDYIEHAVQLLKPKFASLGIEVQPMETEEYARLIQAGVDSLTLYQETYHPESYLTYHISGKKRRFEYRLDAPEKGAQAGFYRINLGALLGLYDWRFEALALSHHLRYLMKHYWQTKYAVSFPRITEMIGAFQPAYTIPDAVLVQLVCAFRLVFPDCGITLSTRESAILRDAMFKLGVTHISAESNTAPGGYSGEKEEPQFQTHDQRSLEEIKAVLIAQGYDPVMKDWEMALL